MTGKSVAKFIVTLAVIAFLAYIALNGITIFSQHIPSIFDEDEGIRRGLDLIGGSVITYEAQIDKATDEDMNTAIGMLRKRLDSLGYLEATITRQGEKRIRIEIPSISNPEEAVEQLGATAVLTFQDSEGNVLLTGKDDIKSAKAVYGPVTSNGSDEHHVVLSFTSEGIEKFYEATKKASEMPAGQKILAIVLDEEVISAPSVDKPINSDSAVIHGNFTAESSKWLAELISAGRLPFELKDIELRSVGPTLGEKSLESSLKAAGIGIILVMIFMLIFYRVPGLIADIALVAYIAIVSLVMILGRVNLSLPGIAGIILSVGMAVDANVIIFERIKEELKAGKTLRTSIDSGFARAFRAIFDANITTLIAAAVLWIFGTGPIKGFAITLSIGIIASMFTAIIITRFLLRQTVNMKIKKISLYGVRGR
jgi:protein-export membrane protein SecD